jgi:hypothetical protein
MIIIKLQGGLGNQMFQFAIATILANKNNDIVLLEDSFFKRKEKMPGFTPRRFELGIFNNSYIIASSSDLLSFQRLSFVDKVKKKIGLNYPVIYNEFSFTFEESLLYLKSPIYIKGYFQSYKYYLGYENMIKNIFSFPIDTLDKKNKKIFLKIKQNNSISIHVRRGDYISDKVTEQFHGTCSTEYYMKAIKILTSENKNCLLLFFSDDSDWAKEQFGLLPYSKIFVNHNLEGNCWKDMLLMSSCNHNIIANSSFSWWAAWLNKNPKKKVIAPKEWFRTKDLDTTTLLPEEWIKL